jgi:murein DD-endopeptidase MepM/ murein hydrolase activator NlpD
VDPSLLPPPIDSSIPGILRLALPHTNVPSRPRQEIIKYTVQSGDTVIGIAEKFGIEPQTILWGNSTILADDPHSLQPGQELNILPINGIYYEWLGGISFEEWADFFGVTAQDIIEYPGNHLDFNNIGDYANPNIEKGTWLIIPGGKRGFANTWYTPVGSSREEPATARAWGPGACGPVSGGAVGYGTYVWPTPHHFLSGYDYSPGSNHWGIDLDGETGDPIYATDAGVVVYAGWNEGYGNMIMIDHGDNWQSLYAHLDAIWVGCGESVGQGQTIAAMGSTGNSSGSHLHFEIMHGGKVNPWDYLPAP